MTTRRTVIPIPNTHTHTAHTLHSRIPYLYYVYLLRVIVLSSIRPKPHGALLFLLFTIILYIIYKRTPSHYTRVSGEGCETHYYCTRGRGLNHYRVGRRSNARGIRKDNKKLNTTPNRNNPNLKDVPILNKRIMILLYAVLDKITIILSVIQRLY